MEDISFHTARNGNTIASFRGVRLHSSFDPVKEAEKFIQFKTAKQVPSTIIISGCSLGYLALAARKYFPHSKIIALFFSDIFYQHSKDNLISNNIISWNKNTHGPLGPFLSNNLLETDIPNLVFFTWPQFEKAYSDYANEISVFFKSFIQIYNGSLKTTQVFGKRWIKNTLKNYIANSFYAKVFPTNKPILITASGPSLSETLPLILPYREKLCVLALPSSLDALKYYSLIPDFVITSDPGFWASQHFHSLPFSSVLISPLSAQLDHFNRDVPVVVLADDIPGTLDCIRNESIPSLTLPPNGTVAGTALEFSLRYTENQIFFLGFDLSAKDIRGHVHPHTFYPLLAQSSYRYQPLHSIYFDRAQLFYPTCMATKPFRISKSLETYADWFRNNSNRWRNRIYRVGFSPVSLTKIPFLSYEDFIKKLKDEKEYTHSNKNKQKEVEIIIPSFNRTQKIDFILSLLNSWLLKINQEKTLFNQNNSTSLSDPLVKKLFKFLCTQDYLQSKNILIKDGRKAFKDHLVASFQKLQQEINTFRKNFLNE